MSFSWNLSFPSPIDDILKKPSFTLQDLLDEDDVVTETGNQKPELLAFLCTKENLSTLISYIVQDPLEDVPINVKFRYPVVACELLCSQNQDIEKILIENEDLLDRIFGFYEAPRINLLLSNLVVKITKTITASRMEPMFAYLRRKAYFIDAYLNHLESSTVTDFFTRFVNIDGEYDGKTVHGWLIEIGFIEKLFDRFGKEFKEVHADLTHLVVDIISVLHSGTPLLNRFLSEESVKYLFKVIMDPENPYGFKYGMKVFNKLLKVISMAQDDNADSDDEEKKNLKPDPLGPIDQLPAPVQVLISNIPQFITLLKSPTKATDEITFSNDAFGFERIVILEMVDNLLDLKYISANRALLESDFFPTAWELVFKFPRNNFCHRCIETIFVKFLEHSGPDAQLTLIEKTDLANTLIRVDKSSLEEKPVPLYRPYLRRMIFCIGEIAEKSPTLNTLLEAIAGWNELLVEIKEERKKMENTIPKVEEEPFFQPSAVPDAEQDGSETYEEGQDDDDEDLHLEDDIDMDSANDADDYDADQSEILLTKQEIEASA
jgi:hypothetical protein